MNRVAFLYVMAMCFLLVSCSKGYEPINYGEEACGHCKMTIVDDRFASELVDAKGKVYKFDDVVCMRQFITEQKKTGDNMLFVEDYLKKQDGAIDAVTAVYLQHEFFSSPMNGDYAAFANEVDARHFSDSLGVRAIKWENLR